MVKGFEVALALGDDEVGFLERLLEQGAAFGEDDPWEVCAGIDGGDAVGDAGRAGVFECGIVNNGCAADGENDLMGRQVIEQQVVEDDFAGVIADIEDGMGVSDGFFQGGDGAEELVLAGPVKDVMKEVFRDFGIGTEVDGVAGDGEPDGEFEGVGCILDFFSQQREEFHGVQIEEFLLLRVGIFETGQAFDMAMDIAADDGGRGGHVHLADFCAEGTQEGFVEGRIVGDPPGGFEGLLEEAGDAIEIGVHDGG